MEPSSVLTLGGSMKKYKIFEVILFAIVMILSFIQALCRTELVFFLLILFSIISTIFIVIFKTSIIKAIAKLVFIWVMVVSVCFLKMPAVGLSFLSIGISVFGLMSNDN